MAKRFYSPSRKGFYVDEIHGPEQIPADAVEITAEEHVGLLAGQASGKVIVIGKSGKPVAADPPAPSPEEVTARTRADIHALVLEALPDVVMALAGTDPEKAGGPGRPGINRRPGKGKAGRARRKTGAEGLKGRRRNFWRRSKITMDAYGEGLKKTTKSCQLPIRIEAYQVSSKVLEW